MFVTALVALDSQKSMFQPPATQVRIKLIAHESGQHGITFAKIGKNASARRSTIPRHFRGLREAKYILNKILKIENLYCI